MHKNVRCNMKIIYLYIIQICYYVKKYLLCKNFFHNSFQKKKNLELNLYIAYRNKIS
jgi:hypothetical protein